MPKPMPKDESKVAVKPTPATKAKGKPAPAARPILYPEYAVRIYAEGEECGPVTEELAKEWLGWEVVKGDRYDFVCPNGDRVICHNNRAGEFGQFPNRPFNPAGCMLIVQDHLNRVYAPDGPNLETCIIGERGSTLSCQHRLISVPWANMYLRGEAKWNGEDLSKHFARKWPEGRVTMQTLVAFGAKETPANIRTYDNTRGRTVADVYYTEGWFRTHTDGERQRLSKLLETATRTLRERAIRDADSYNPERTIQSMIGTTRAHERLVKCVEHLFVENGGSGGRRIDGIISVGTASALLYLMASSGSDGDAYRARMHQGEEPTEEGLDWTRWDRACEFWVELGSEAADLDKAPPIQRAVREALAFLDDECSLKLRDRIAVVVNAWLNYVEGQPCVGRDLLPDYTLNADDPLNKFRVIHDNPECGGLDCGWWSGKADDERPDRDEPTAEQQAAIDAEIAAEQARKDRAAVEDKADARSFKSAEGELPALRELFPDSKMLFVGLQSCYCYGDDAEQVGKLLRISVARGPKRSPMVCFRRADLDEALEKLRRAGQTIQLVERVGTVWTPINGQPNGMAGDKPAPAAKANGKKPAAKAAPKAAKPKAKKAAAKAS